MNPAEKIMWMTPAHRGDALNILKICQNIREAISNPAFFNWSEASLSAEIENSKWILFKLNQQPVGFICFKENIDFIEVMVLGTAPEHRNKAVMKQLLGFLKNYAAKQNKKISLEVHQQNLAAIDLYERLFFILIHERKSYYSDGSSAHLYEWSPHTEY